MKIFAQTGRNHGGPVEGSVVCGSGEKRFVGVVARPTRPEWTSSVVASTLLLRPLGLRLPRSLTTSHTLLAGCGLSLALYLFSCSC